MPRNPGAKKFQHNNRHENGLVGPGKRVTKQKSTGQLNGHAKPPVSNQPYSAVTSSEPPVSGQAIEQLPTPPLESTLDLPRKPSQSTLSPRETESSSPNQTQDHAECWEATNGTTMAVQRRADPIVSKERATPDLSAVQIASTILRSRPAYDTIALLIVLLALPSVILTMVQALFASLTIMPGAGFSPVSFLSLFDVFQGSAGSPSLSTMAVVDSICFALWICLWNWAQSFALDLAQIQIAITLGNGSSGKNNGVNTFCFAVVLFLHTIRSKGVRRFLVSNPISTRLMIQTRLADVLQYLPGDADFGESTSSISKLWSFPAIHIISQALMAFVRRRVASTSSGGNIKPGKRVDSEAVAGSNIPDSPSIDASTSLGISSSVDHQASQYIPKETKEKGINSKKRRRQANHVRSRQPFWAALASTKVHVLREVEHSKGLPNASLNQKSPSETTQEDSVCVTSVDPSSINFEANFTLVAYQEPDLQTSGECKPFFVRINGARWHSVSLDGLNESGRHKYVQSQWSGSISGLAPNCTYTCSFVRSDDDEEFASVLVKTPALLDKDLTSSMVPIPVRQSTRPSSPATTLKNSIASAEVKLNDARGRLTKQKRQHKTSLAKVEKDLESLHSRLKSSSDDSKQRQKLLQAERNTRLHEDAISQINTALVNLDTLPEEESKHYSTRKKAYEEQSKVLVEANEILQKAKTAGESDLACVNGELNTTATRKDRLITRQTKLTEQHDRITEANAQGLNGKERKAADSAAREADQQRRETDLASHINAMAAELRDIQLRTQGFWRDIEAMEKQDVSQRQKLMMNHAPVTPEGDLPGTRSPQHAARPLGYGNFQNLPNAMIPPDPQASPFLAYVKTLPSDHRRPRSDTNHSMGATSNMSADFDDADPIPPMPSTTDYDVDGRKGSGSSRGKNNGSPAGAGIGGLRSPQRGNHSPGHVPGSTTW